MNLKYFFSILIAFFCGAYSYHVFQTSNEQGIKETIVTNQKIESTDKKEAPKVFKTYRLYRSFDTAGKPEYYQWWFIYGYMDKFNEWAIEGKKIKVYMDENQDGIVVDFLEEPLNQHSEKRIYDLLESIAHQVTDYKYWKDMQKVKEEGGEVPDFDTPRIHRR